ncbi:hypothetical protein FACS189447_09330 [Spirochaetia bacterium]|nr:hypothetical protein FACS189447_09330 [Spirochaetia bacterium]
MRVLFGALIILYPLLVFSALVIFKLSIRYLSILIMLLAVVYAIVNRKQYHGRHPVFVYISPVILFTIGIVCLSITFFIDTEDLSKVIFKLYPALADLVYLTIFGTSLFIPPTIVYSFINVFDKKLNEHLEKVYFENYCRKCTVYWCVFFILDCIVSLITALFESDLAWGIYNGGITYVLMGLLFVGEYVIIKVIEKRTVLVQKTEEQDHDHS